MPTLPRELNPRRLEGRDLKGRDLSQVFVERKGSFPEREVTGKDQFRPGSMNWELENLRETVKSVLEDVRRPDYLERPAPKGDTWPFGLFGRRRPDPEGVYKGPSLRCIFRDPGERRRHDAMRAGQDRLWGLLGRYKYNPFDPKYK